VPPGRYTIQSEELSTATAEGKRRIEALAAMSRAIQLSFATSENTPAGPCPLSRGPGGLALPRRASLGGRTSERGPPFPRPCPALNQTPTGKDVEINKYEHEIWYEIKNLSAKKVDVDVYGSIIS
jgi:hypothetical protein